MESKKLDLRSRRFFSYTTGLRLLWIGIALLAVAIPGAVLTGHLVWYP